MGILTSPLIHVTKDLYQHYILQEICIGILYITRNLYQLYILYWTMTSVFNKLMFDNVYEFSFIFGVEIYELICDLR